MPRQNCNSMPVFAVTVYSVFTSKVVKRQISKWYAARQDIKTTLKNDSIQANAYENATINYIHELTQHVKSIAPVSADTE